MGEVVQAQRFEVVDSEGRVRAELGLAPGEERVGLRLFDLEGNMRVSIQQINDGPCGGGATVTLFDCNTMRAQLSAFDFAPAGFVCYNTDGDPVPPATGDTPVKFPEQNPYPSG